MAINQPAPTREGAPQPEDLIFRALPVGPMANLAYLVGSRRARQALLVDTAWDIAGLLDAAAKEGLEVVGVLATHGHPDHVGGNMFGLDVPGLTDLLRRVQVPVHVHKLEAESILRATQISETSLVCHEGGDVITLGDLQIKLLHTPGHTPGGMCFLIDNVLLSGDTLFIQACGRVDLPGGDPEALFASLSQQLARLPEQTRLYPGHAYGGRSSSTIGEELQTNDFLRMRTLDDWLPLVGLAPRQRPV